MAAGATAQADALGASADVAETPWYEDGEDHGRDLGTGATDADGNRPQHNVETPRDLDGEHGAASLPVEEAEEETPPSNAAPTPNQTQRTPAPSVPPGPTGKTDEKTTKPTGSGPTAPEGGNG